MISYISRNFAVKILSSSDEAAALINSGSSIAVGGFGNSGVPQNILQALARTETNNLTIVSNNCAVQGYGLDHILQKGKIKRVVASYIGGNKLFEDSFIGGQLQLIITPQGTLAQKLRAGGAGIPAFFTATGAGTIISNGQFPIKYKPGTSETEIPQQPKQERIFGDRKYVLQKSINTDFAIVKAWKGDTLGNLVYRGSAQNFNPLCAMAGKFTIAEVEEIVEAGQLSPTEIHTQGIYVQAMVKGQKLLKPIEILTLNTGGEIQIPGKGESKLIREKIIRRAAKELKNGMNVNLGIGMPTLIPNFLPKDMTIYLQSENGILGMGPYPNPGEEDADLINAGKETVTLIQGASLFNSSDSFAMIRGGHIDLSVLGALQVSKNGDLANWIIPGKMVKGIGGAMDLVASPSKCIITMEHTQKGQKKLLNECNLPLTGAGVVDLLITELGVFDFQREGGITLIEIGKGENLEKVKAETECEFIVASDLKEMEF